MRYPESPIQIIFHVNQYVIIIHPREHPTLFQPGTIFAKQYFQKNKKGKSNNKGNRVNIEPVNAYQFSLLFVVIFKALLIILTFCVASANNSVLPISILVSSA